MVCEWVREWWMGIGEVSVEVSRGFAGHGEVKVGIVGHWLGKVKIGGHFVVVAEVVEY